GERSRHHRSVRLGPRDGRWRSRADPGVPTTLIFESVALTLQSIWANKLRSFMTLLGNIVAVTSIVTVVSLIQGMNAMVSKAIVSQVGADAFTVERVPFTRTDDDIERVRANPLITLPEADAIRSFSPTIRSVMA